MSEALSRPVVLDGTVLSNYASTASVPWLTTTLDGLRTVPAVRNELKHGREVGYGYLADALEIIAEGHILIAEDVPTHLQEDYQELATHLDAGEAEAFAAAATGDGTLVTDDGAARALAAEYEVSLTGSIDLLVRGVLREDISLETPEEWLTTWVEERNYDAPIDSVGAALPEDVEE